MPPITPTFPPWTTGDLVSASKLNGMMDWIDTALALQEQRNMPVDSGANVLDCAVYGRPFYGYNQGSQVEYWLAHNGDTLVIKLSGTDPAYLYWRFDGVNYGAANAVLAPGVEHVIPLSATQLANLYQYQPIRIALRSTYHPNNSIFVDYIYQTDSAWLTKAGTVPTLGTMPTFTDGDTSSADDLNLIQTETENALTCLNQPIPCQYSNDDRAGTRQYYVGWVRHMHERFYVDVTLSMQAEDNFYVRYDGGDVSGHTGSYDGVLIGNVPAGRIVGNWYKVELVIDRHDNEEHEQHVTLWSYAEVQGTFFGGYSGMGRWEHGDEVSGNNPPEPYLNQMSISLDEISDVLRYVNLPCRTAGSIILDEGDNNCAGAQIIDGMSAYRVHRWLAYNTFRKADGNYATATLQWFTAGRNLQSYSLPTAEAPAFFDMESTPVKPGMWFKVVNAGFAIQTPSPGVNYA